MVKAATAPDLQTAALLSLIRSALWQSTEPTLPTVDWEALERQAQTQGVLWLVYLGAKRVAGVPPRYLSAWRAAMHCAVLGNQCVNDAQNRLLAWLQEQKIPAVILKGTGCARYYPWPEARPLGDIDVLIRPRDLERVDRYLRGQGFAPSEQAHGFHVGYLGSMAEVEVHYAASTLPDSPGGAVAAAETERFLEDRQWVHMGEMTFPVPSESHQALMLLLHMERHMLVTGIGLRQLCDWAVFVSNSPQGHWQDTLPMLRRCGLLTYAQVLTRVCVEELGLDPEKAPWCREVPGELFRQMLTEILRSGSLGAGNSGGSGNLFTQRSTLGQKAPGLSGGVLGKLTEISYERWPFTRRWKQLLPLFWGYLSLRYVLRTALSPRKTLRGVLSVSNKQRKLYRALKLYQAEK